jgi:hypothetical protein
MKDDVLKKYDDMEFHEHFCLSCGRPISAEAAECECESRKPRKRKRASARAESRKPKVSYADIKAAFERNKEGL